MRYPSLDGLRAVSISLVILWHFNTAAIPGLWRIDYGNLGVRVFFVISGFLITSLLLEEQQRTGAISLKRFFTRRIARIIPAYWVFVGCIALLGLSQNMLPAIAYYSNYKDPGLALGATWSLSVEEQFYLLWPLALVLIGLSRGLYVCILVMCVAPVFRVLAEAGVWPVNSRYAFECVADALATGCLLALLGKRVPLIPYAPWLPVVVLALIALQPSGFVVAAVGISALNIALALAMRHLIARPPKLLNTAVVVWVGTLSYSLYLWQQPFIGVKAWIALPAILACACVSYYLIEKPARRWLNNFFGSRAAEVGTRPYRQRS